MWMNINLVSVLLLAGLLTVVTAARRPQTKNDCKEFQFLDGDRCKECPVCPIGHGLSKDCGHGNGKDPICLPCGEGVNFNPFCQEDTSHPRKTRFCQPCRNCSKYYRVTKHDCRTVVNAQCGQCQPGYYDPHREASDKDRNLYPCSHCSNDPDDHECATWRQKQEESKHQDKPPKNIELQVKKGTSMQTVIAYCFGTFLLGIIVCLVGLCCWCRFCQKGRSCTNMSMEFTPTGSEDNIGMSPTPGKKKSTGNPQCCVPIRQTSSELPNQTREMSREYRVDRELQQTRSPVCVQGSQLSQEDKTTGLKRSTGSDVYRQTDESLSNEQTSLLENNTVASDMNDMNVNQNISAKPRPVVKLSERDKGKCQNLDPDETVPKNRQVEKEMMLEAVPHSPTEDRFNNIPRFDSIVDNTDVGSLVRQDNIHNVSGASTVDIRRDRFTGPHSQQLPLIHDGMSQGNYLPSTISGSERETVPPVVSQSDRSRGRSSHSGITSAEPEGVLSLVSSANSVLIGSPQRSSTPANYSAFARFTPVPGQPGEPSGNFSTTIPVNANAMATDAAQRDRTEVQNQVTELDDQRFRKALQLSNDARMRILTTDIKDKLDCCLQDKHVVGGKNLHDVADKFEVNPEEVSQLKKFRDLFDNLKQKEVTIKELLNVLKDLGIYDATNGLSEWVIAKYPNGYHEKSSQEVRETDEIVLPVAIQEEGASVPIPESH